MLLIVPLDGLFRTDQGKPFMIGQALYKVLRQDYQVVIASPMTTGDTEDLLRRNALLGWTRIHEGSVKEALAQERARGGHVHFCITPDAEEAAEIFEQGVSVLVISGTDFVNPKWRREKVAWSDLPVEAGW